MHRSLLAALTVSLSVVQPAAAETSSPEPGWYTLGTSGGPQVRVERAQISNALVVDDAVYLFDTGNDVQRQMARAGIAEDRVRAIFLSHHHLDHNADLGPLLMTRWTFGGGPLAVIGPEGTRTLVEGLIAANAPTRLAGYPTAGPAKPSLASLVTVVEIPSDVEQPTEIYRDGAIAVSTIGVDHYQTAPSIELERMPRAVAYRVTAGGRTIAYTGDSGPSDLLVQIAKGADLLVSEVVELDSIRAQLRAGMDDAPDAVLRGISEGMAHNHLTPEAIGRLAARAEVGEVVLTHFVPVPESVPDTTVYGREIGAHFRGAVHLAHDLNRF